MPDQEDSRELSDPAALRALGHPLRQQLLELLHRDGPATSTSVADALGQNTGTTSYHLRQLADHGFIEEMPGRGRGRERWWRARERDIRFAPRSRMGAQTRAAFEEFGRLGVEADLAAFERFHSERDSMGDWGDALVFSRGALCLTGEQLRQFWLDYLALLNRYAVETGSSADTDTSADTDSSADTDTSADTGSPEEPDSHTDARRVLLRFVAFPDVP